MTKKDEIYQEGSCFNKASQDEIMFILLARDAAAPAAINAWIHARVKLGLNGPVDEQLGDAIKCRDAMEKQFHDIKIQKAKKAECARIRQEFLAAVDDLIATIPESIEAAHDCGLPARFQVHELFAEFGTPKPTPESPKLRPDQI